VILGFTEEEYEEAEMMGFFDIANHVLFPPGLCD